MRLVAKVYAKSQSPLTPSLSPASQERGTGYAGAKRRGFLSRLHLPWLAGERRGVRELLLLFVPLHFAPSHPIFSV